MTAAAAAVVLATFLGIGLATKAEASSRYYGCWTEWRMKRIGPIKTRVPTVVCGWRDRSGR
jgi:hypothetical protein